MPWAEARLVNPTPVAPASPTPINGQVAQRSPFAGIQGRGHRLAGVAPISRPRTPRGVMQRSPKAGIHRAGRRIPHPGPLCHPPLVKTAYTFYSYEHHPPVKAARKVEHRRQPARWRRRMGRQRNSGGAEARAPFRRRRAHSHQPGLCSDKWGASRPDGGAVADARRLGRRRSDGGPGPTKPVQPLSTPQRGASSRTCDHPHRPHNPPPTKPSRSDRRRSQGQHQRPQVRSPLGALQGRPHRHVPGPGGPRLLRPGPPSTAPQRAPCSRGAAQGLVGALAGFSRQKQSYPRLSEGESPSFKKRLKKSVDNQPKENNQMALLLTKAAKPSNDVPHNPPPQSRRAGDPR